MLNTKTETKDRLRNPVKCTFTLLLCTLGISSFLTASPAGAANVQVENAIKSRPDLSSFYQALVNTGVINELRPAETYTVFAPDNAAFAKIKREEYPCFYSVRCKAEVAGIVRNHIVFGKISIDDIIGHQGGLFSVNQRFIPVGESGRGYYTVDGQYIRASTAFDGDILYTIDGVIASKRELTMLPLLDYVTVPREHVTLHEKTIPDPACGPAGCSDEYTKTTTIDRTILSPYPR